jgi:hypothetical protein
MESKKGEASLYYKKAVDTLSSITEEKLSERDDVQGEYFKTLAMSYDGLGCYTKNAEYLKHAKDLYSKFLKNYKDHKDYDEVKSFYKALLIKITNHARK